MMSWRGFLASLSIVLAACGGDGPSGPIGGGGFGTLSAVIDGVPWSAPGIYQTASAQEAGTFTFGGSNGIQGTTLALTLKYISAPGTYPLGVGSPVPGGGATLTVSAPASGFWWSALTGASGTVTVSSVSATNIAGTFNFTATRLPAQEQRATNPLRRDSSTSTFQLLEVSRFLLALAALSPEL